LIDGNAGTGFKFRTRRITDSKWLTINNNQQLNSGFPEAVRAENAPSAVFLGRFDRARPKPETFERPSLAVVTGGTAAEAKLQVSANFTSL
jgi:hypothetical protein